ncbi:MAG: hypothetical protein Q7R95_10695 [bacterium]|nr:hypothetical protein [bacterium]
MNNKQGNNFNLVIFKEKHGDRYFYAPTFDDLYRVALKIFHERAIEDIWYDFSTHEEKMYKKALKDKKGDIVLEFLRSRNNYEYEDFDIISTEKY